jgi:hypothetical protein
LIDDESYNCKALFSILKCLKLQNLEDSVEMAFSGRAAIRKVEENIVENELG